MNDSKCAAEPGCPNPGVVVELDCGPIGFEDVPICELHLAQYQREGRVFSRLPSTPPACPSCAALESVEAARRDAQESRFALIVENEELGADLAATRARLESAEAKCQLSSMDGTLTACACCGARGIPSRGTKPHHDRDCPFAALDAAGEKESSDG